jgi:Dolichyl-phosphate-mannose-protein mannosyltransferase
VAINPGGVPLGYLTQHFVIATLGFSASSARLPSILSSVLACIGMAIWGKSLGLRRYETTISALIFAVLPLQFRYALEARPYEQALLFCIALNVSFEALCRRPNWRSSTIYGLIALVGVYTQPFVLMVWLSQLVWALLFLRETSRIRVVRWCAVSGGIAVLAFLPWFLFARNQWRAHIASSYYSFNFSWSTVSLLLREVTGSYFLTALLGTAIVLGLRDRSTLSRGAKALLTANVLIPMTGALCADVTFNYFVAARQFIFILPPLSLLGAVGVTSLVRDRKYLGLLLFSLLLAAAAIQDIKMFGRRRENWAAAATSISVALGPKACLITAPEEWEPLYAFFEPALNRRQCGADRRSFDHVVLVSTPYTVAGALAGIQSDLRNDGYALRHESEVGGSHLKLFAKY